MNLKRGYHGTRMMSDEEVQATYGADKCITFNGSSNKRYWSLTTYFEAPLAPLYAAIIDFADGEEEKAEG